VWTRAPDDTRENVSVSFRGRKAVMIEINSKGRHSREVEGMLCYVIVGCTVQYRLIRQSRVTGPRHEIWCLSQVTQLELVVTAGISLYKDSLYGNLYEIPIHYI
jgi:hypothetical protein